MDRVPRNSFGKILNHQIVNMLLHFFVLLGVIVLPKLVDLINQVRDLSDIYVWLKGIQIIVHACSPSTFLDTRQLASATIRLLFRNIKKNSNLRNRTLMRLLQLGKHPSGWWAISSLVLFYSSSILLLSLLP
jgi:hypothetical protein